MPPRREKTLPMESEDDIKKTLDVIVIEMSDIKKQQEKLINLITEINELKQLNREKDLKLMLMESRISELEQQQYANDVVITGVDVKYRSYARAAGGMDGTEQDDQDMESTEEQLISKLHERSIAIEKMNIDTCYMLRNKANIDNKIVILKLKDRKSKISLLKQGRVLKGTNIYINERLSKANNDIAKKARELRKQGKIAHTWTKDGRTLIKKDHQTDKVFLIRSMQDLNSFT